MDESATKYGNDGVPAYSDNELPTQLENDALGCPRCIVELVNGKSRVFVDRTNIGAFDSLSCVFCGFFLLTAKGFDESAKVIKQFALDTATQNNASENQQIENSGPEMIIKSNQFRPKPEGNPISPELLNSFSLLVPLVFPKPNKKKSSAEIRDLPLLTLKASSSASHRNES